MTTDSPAARAIDSRVGNRAGIDGLFRRPAAALAAVLVLVPVAAIAFIAAQGSGDMWPHLAAYVIPRALRSTLLLLAGVGALAFAIGVPAGWVVARYDFPLRRLLEGLLLLPLAVPTYIAAYAYLDLLHPLGPLSAVPARLLGADAPWRLPDIRNLWGCILVIGFVLYPYVYLAARASFRLQTASAIEAAQMLGAGPVAVLLRVAMPLSSPAILLGLSLALLETLNDVGASEFLGVRTLTVSIYHTWINSGSLPGAAQIALVLFACVGAVLALTWLLRRQAGYAGSAAEIRPLARRALEGYARWTAPALLALPVLIGFGLPAAHLAGAAIARIEFAGFGESLHRELVNSLMLATLTTIVAVFTGWSLAQAARADRRPAIRAAVSLAGIGYAVPGIVLATGILFALGRLDNAVDAAARSTLGVSTGLLTLGTIVGLLYAYSARFLLIATGALRSGLAKLPDSIDAAARLLGAGTLRLWLGVHAPMLTPAILTAALLVFVDVMKELPATLLLRPLNFETLATHLYAEAVRGAYEDGAVAALLIVACGLVPVLALVRLNRPFAR